MTVTPPAGSPDLAFGKNGKLTTIPGNPENASGVAQTMAIQSDGKMLVGGDSFSGNDVEFMLMRYGADGKLDPSFGEEGNKKAFSSAGSGGKVVLGPDDSIVVAGTVFDPTPNNLTNDFFIGFYDTDGNFQRSTTVGFSGHGFPNRDLLSAIALQPDGKVLVAGSTFSMDINKAGSDSDFALARFNDDGTLDTLFGTNGTVITTFVPGDAVHTDDDFANAMVLQPDGKIILAGSSVDGLVTKFALARYKPDGSLDTGFGIGGKVVTAIGKGDAVATSVQIQSNGKIVAGGYTRTILPGGTISSPKFRYHLALARYNPNGSLDTAFGKDGTVNSVVDVGNDSILDLAIQSDGKIVAGGYSNAANSDFAIARFNPDGTFDTTFGLSGIRIFPVGLNNDYVNAVAIQPDGKIIVAGGASIGTRYEFALARFWP